MNHSRRDSGKKLNNKLDLFNGYMSVFEVIR